MYCLLNVLQEAMRGSTIIDTDGVSEYYRVRLEPSDWYACAFYSPLKYLISTTATYRAKIAERKANAGESANQLKTAEWYTWEIVRLEKRQKVMQMMVNVRRMRLPIDCRADPNFRN